MALPFVPTVERGISMRIKIGGFEIEIGEVEFYFIMIGVIIVTAILNYK